MFTGTFPNILKSDVVWPLLKITNLDNLVFSNYKPISDLQVSVKSLKKVVFERENT